MGKPTIDKRLEVLNNRIDDMEISHLLAIRAINTNFEELSDAFNVLTAAFNVLELEHRQLLRLYRRLSRASARNTGVIQIVHSSLIGDIASRISHHHEVVVETKQEDTEIMLNMSRLKIFENLNKIYPLNMEKDIALAEEILEEALVLTEIQEVPLVFVTPREHDEKEDNE